MKGQPERSRGSATPPRDRTGSGFGDLADCVAFFLFVM